ncbi:metallophosphoesterase [Anaeromyxobacter sp. K]|uniref:Metallophosphoesterase n=1 Tax=Anaeromyxobacter dehalogenans (strain ATCC BAA-258 / DSM 21875 / 2CP-1) TaxID=455488 RepID=B8JGE6_ANAD2|nr:MULTISPECIES: metallophosphoesterase [Anaeromyxobacter]ACG72437.1 metallophosphoesterase [Anaeromyxobacter sp. K]ACL64617.1 metallophosphoesterase [Anaeromyxobacter dehalogenans 2CP-1]
MDRFGRRQFLKGAALLGAAGAAGLVPAASSAAEPRLPDTDPVTFEVPGLDPAHDGLRIAQLSDLHVGPRTPSATVRAAIEDANAFAPDLVVLTGDYLSHSRRELAAMRDLLGGLVAPTIAVLGNHDVWVDPDGAAGALKGHGYEVLENGWTSIRLRGAPLHVVGVGDHLTRRDDVQRAVKGLPAGAAPLVLAHGPRTADKLRHLERPMVCLSGHTHGGQINIPILTPLFLASVAREPYVRGRYQLGAVQLYVNRGIGMSGIRVRVNASPEVTLATLRRAEPA